jgi:hypothetical protein
MIRIDELTAYLKMVSQKHCSSRLNYELFDVTFGSLMWSVSQPRQALLAGLASLKVALPAAAEGAVASTAVDDGLAANEEVGDAL